MPRSRDARVGGRDLDVLTEVVDDAWLARASATARARWLAARGLEA